MRLLLLVCGIMAASMGCVHSYRPAATVNTATETRQRDILLEPTHIIFEDYRGVPMRVVLSVRSTVAAQVEGAWLAQQSDPPCAGGIGSVSMSVDRGQSLLGIGIWQAMGSGQSALSPETAALALSFSNRDLAWGGVFAEAPTMVDVSIRRPGGSSAACIRVPLVPRKNPAEWVEGARGREWWLGLGTGWVILPGHPHDLSGPGYLSLRGGTWRGPVRLGAEATFALLRVGGMTSDGLYRMGGGVGGALTIDAPLHVWRGGRMPFWPDSWMQPALFGNVAYEVLYVHGSPAGGGTLDTALHGPRLALHLALAPGEPPRPGFVPWQGHAWVVPGWESPKGVFSHADPNLRCADGTVRTDAVGFCPGT